MRSEVNYIHAIDFINLFHTMQGQGNYKKISQNPENGVAIPSKKLSWLNFIYIEPKCV